MHSSTLLFTSALLGLASAQHPGEIPENHPQLLTWECTNDGGCVQKNTWLVLDSLNHPVYQVDHPEYNCGDWGGPPNATACPDAETCQQNCVMQGVPDYTKSGVVTDGGAVTLHMMDENQNTLSPRVYLLGEDKTTYEMLHLTGYEFSYDVDVSKLPCGSTGALYTNEMPADGGLSELNTAGAYWGTGHCDAQCFTTPFVNGAANIEGYGACCAEMDLWEANGYGSHLAPHTCSEPGFFLCEGEECGRTDEGVCDKPGCAYNPWTVGNREAYGPGLAVDTTRPFKVITQFPVDEDGIMREIHRLYIQDGKLIEMGETRNASLPEQNYITDDYCAAVPEDAYLRLGGQQGMGESLTRGHVLVMSIWMDYGHQMTWLDGASTGRGPCLDGEGHPDVIKELHPDTQVTFSNLKWGEIGSTWKNPSNCTIPARKRSTWY